MLKQTSFTVLASMALWVVTFYINGGDISSQPLPFVGYLGFLLGVLLGFHLEQKFLGFNPKSKHFGIRLVRWGVTIGLVMIPVIFLDETFKTSWSTPTYLSHLFQYLGYTLSGLLGIFIAPLIFIKLKLVDRFL